MFTFNFNLKGPKGDQGEKGDRGYTTTLNSDQFPTGIIEGPPGPPGMEIYPLTIHSNYKLSFNGCELCMEKSTRLVVVNFHFPFEPENFSYEIKFFYNCFMHSNCLKKKVWHLRAEKHKI